MTAPQHPSERTSPEEETRLRYEAAALATDDVAEQIWLAVLGEAAGIEPEQLEAMASRRAGRGINGTIADALADLT